MLAILFSKKLLKRFLKTVSLDTMIDKHIGKRGTLRREAFKNELRIDFLGQAIKQARTGTEHDKRTIRRISWGSESTNI